MIIKIIINILLIFILTMIQFSFISGLPAPFNNLNLILISLVFILAFTSLDAALWWAVLFGFLLDIFSFSFFGQHLISLTLTTVLVYLLLNNFFTNRSLYSLLALVSFATIIYEVCLNSFSYIVNFTNKTNVIFFGINFWQAKLIQLSLNLLLALILFYSLHFISNRLSPVFLLKKPNK